MRSDSSSRGPAADEGFEDLGKEFEHLAQGGAGAEGPAEGGHDDEEHEHDESGGDRGEGGADSDGVTADRRGAPPRAPRGAGGPGASWGSAGRARPRRPAYEDEVARRQIEFFQNLPPAQKWWLERVGPECRADGSPVQLGVYPQPINGLLRLETIFARIGGGSIRVCADEDPYSPKARWHGPVEILGEPRADIDLDTNRKRSAGPARSSGEDPDRLVEVYDADRGLFVRVPRSQAHLFGRPTKPPADPSAGALAAVLEGQRQISEVLRALADKPAAPAPAPPTGSPTQDLMFKELVAALKDKGAARERPAPEAGVLGNGEIMRILIDALKPSAQPKPMEGISALLGLAEKIADMRSGKAGVDRFDKIVDLVSGGLSRFYSTAENPLMKILDRAAELLPMVPPTSPPRTPPARQIEAPAVDDAEPEAEGAPPESATATPPAPAQGTPAPQAAPAPAAPPVDLRMVLSLVLEAADGFCDTLEGKVPPEEFWAKVAASAPAAVLKQLRAIECAPDVAAALVRMAKHPAFAPKRERLLEASRLATGAGLPIAERLVEIIQAAAGGSSGASPA